LNVGVVDALVVVAMFGHTVVEDINVDIGEVVAASGSTVVVEKGQVIVGVVFLKVQKRVCVVDVKVFVRHFLVWVKSKDAVLLKVLVFLNNVRDGIVSVAVDTERVAAVVTAVLLVAVIVICEVWVTVVDSIV
jgi:hypothetical protein